MKLVTHCFTLVVLTLSLFIGCREAERLPHGAELAEIARYEADVWKASHYPRNAGHAYASAKIARGACDRKSSPRSEQLGCRRLPRFARRS